MTTLEQMATARPATMDATSSGTLAAKQIRLTGPAPHVTDNYLIVGAEPAHPDFSPKHCYAATTVTIDTSFALPEVD